MSPYPSHSVLSHNLRLLAWCKRFLHDSDRVLTDSHQTLRAVDAASREVRRLPAESWLVLARTSRGGR
jgi:hypothetical protein